MKNKRLGIIKKLSTVKSSILVLISKVHSGPIELTNAVEYEDQLFVISSIGETENPDQLEVLLTPFPTKSYNTQ